MLLFRKSNLYTGDHAEEAVLDKNILLLKKPFKINHEQLGPGAAEDPRTSERWLAFYLCLSQQHITVR